MNGWQTHLISATYQVTSPDGDEWLIEGQFDPSDGQVYYRIVDEDVVPFASHIAAVAYLRKTRVAS